MGVEDAFRQHASQTQVQAVFPGWEEELGIVPTCRQVMSGQAFALVVTWRLLTLAGAGALAANQGPMILGASVAVVAGFGDCFFGAVWVLQDS